MNKFVLGDILVIHGQLNKLIEKSNEDRLPAALAFKLAKLFKEVSVHFTDFDKHRADLVQKYGKPDSENPGSFIVEKENIAGFNDELNKLLTVDIEFKPSVSFKFSDFDNTKIDIGSASALLPFISEDEKPAS